MAMRREVKTRASTICGRLCTKKVQMKRYPPVHSTRTDTDARQSGRHAQCVALYSDKAKKGEEPLTLEVPTIKWVGCDGKNVKQEVAGDRLVSEGGVDSYRSFYRDVSSGREGSDRTFERYSVALQMTLIQDPGRRPTYSK